MIQFLLRLMTVDNLLTALRHGLKNDFQAAVYLRNRIYGCLLSTGLDGNTAFVVTNAILKDFFHLEINDIC